MAETELASIVRTLAVIMERRAVTGNRWQSECWDVAGVVAGMAEQAGGERVIVRDDRQLQILYPGHEVRLSRDEAEGYYLNITSVEPKVFVLWRMLDDIARPERLTVSYHEGARWMDSDEKVDGVTLPAELLPWIAGFVEQHYQPEPRKEKRYATNKDRGRMGRLE